MVCVETKVCSLNWHHAYSQQCSYICLNRCEYWWRKHSARKPEGSRPALSGRLGPGDSATVHVFCWLLAVYHMHIDRRALGRIFLSQFCICTLQSYNRICDVMIPCSYTLSREYWVVRNRYSRLLNSVTSEEQLSPICTCKNSWRILHHNASSRDVTNRLWWRRDV